MHLPESKVTQNIVKVLSNMSAQRFSEVAQAFVQTMDLIRPLLNLDLPKEIEPGTYLNRLAAAEGEDKAETK
jgi:hypothetical protein